MSCPEPCKASSVPASLHELPGTKGCRLWICNTNLPESLFPFQDLILQARSVLAKGCSDANQI
jgi:hypothetical protein